MKDGYYTLEEWIRRDECLDVLINSKIDPKKFDWQIALRCAAIKIAVAQWMDYKY